MMEQKIFEDERIGSRRNELIESGLINREEFEKLTPKQRSLGLLTGKLLMAKGNQQIEDAFTWFAQEHQEGKALSVQEKALILIQTTGHISIDENGYRAIRKIFVQANQ